MTSYFARDKEKRHKLSLGTRISTYLVLEIALGQICIKVHRLVDIVIIPSSY
jgi:hypothetical protein